jgi:GDPmannose 4,6-dehydratase
VYNLAAQSHVRVSFEMPDYTGNISGLGTVRLLEAIRKSGLKSRFYQASTSEMFGDAPPPQNEETPFHPRSPYAAAKAYAYWMVQNYREAYGVFAVNGIMFNHESPRRGEMFVSRKITHAIAEIRAGRQKSVALGNLDAQRDWGYAPEYVEAMWQMLQQETPFDLVFGTGETHTVQEFVEEAFAYAGLDWREHVTVDPRFMRPTEVPLLLADASAAKRRIGWEPRIGFHDLVRIMVDADLEAAGLPAPGEGTRRIEACRFTWLGRP